MGAAIPASPSQSGSAPRAGTPTLLLRTYWTLTASVFAFALWLALFYAPVHDPMGLVQKLVYLHIPSAAASLVASACVFIASIALLWTHARTWDAVSNVATRIVVIASAIVLITGMIWGKSYWGVWWTWSPRLTFTLVLFVLYAVLQLLRRFLQPASRCTTVCAIFGVIAFLDAPLVYLSVRLLPDVHPTSVPMTHEMRLTLAVWFVLTGLVCLGIICTPFLQRTGSPSPLVQAPPPSESESSQSVS